MFFFLNNLSWAGPSTFRSQVTSFPTAMSRSEQYATYAWVSWKGKLCYSLALSVSGQTKEHSPPPHILLKSTKVLDAVGVHCRQSKNSSTWQHLPRPDRRTLCIRVGRQTVGRLELLGPSRKLLACKLLDTVMKPTKMHSWGLCSSSGWKQTGDATIQSAVPKAAQSSAMGTKGTPREAKRIGLQ